MLDAWQKIPGIKVKRIALAKPMPMTTLALGTDRALSVCAAKNGDAWLATLSNPFNPFDEQKLEELVRAALTDAEFMPQVMVTDLNEQLATSKLALRVAANYGLSLAEVQHEEALMSAQIITASTLIERAVLCTLTTGGEGFDGNEWGGEYYRLGKAGLERLGYFLPVSLPGGSYADAEPYRMMLSYLWTTFGNVKIDQFFYESVDRGVFMDVWELLKHPEQNLQTTSFGRLMDAVLALLTNTLVVDKPGQAAKKLVTLARKGNPEVHTLPFEVGKKGDQFVVDTRPIIGKLVEKMAFGGDKADMAMAFVKTVAKINLEMVKHLSHTHKLPVVLAGEFFKVELIREFTIHHCRKLGVEVIWNETVGGENAVALGQIGKQILNSNN